jgi:hypothetical protein
MAGLLGMVPALIFSPKYPILKDKSLTQVKKIRKN